MKLEDVWRIYAISRAEKRKLEEAKAERVNRPSPLKTPKQKFSDHRKKRKK